MANSKNNIMYNARERKKIDEQILEKVKHDTLLSQFTSIYLNSLTNRAVANEIDNNLQAFIEKRYKTFIKFIESKHEYILNIKQTKKDNKVTFEIVCTDAQYLIFTLESLFKQFNLKITKTFHPLMSVQSNKKSKISSISNPSKKGELISLPYFECDIPSDNSLIQRIEAEIKHRIKAVHIAKEHQEHMLNVLREAQQEVAKHPTPNKDFQSEWVELIDWLANENFSFFGFAKFDLRITKDEIKVKEEKKSCLGILDTNYLKQSSSPLLSVLKKQISDLATYRSPFIFDAIRFTSPVKRSEKLMRLSLKIPVKKGRWIEYNFLGLLKRSSLFAKNLETPIIKLKLKKIFEKKHYFPGSHNYYQTIRFCNNIPKYELFRTPTENLQKMIEDLISISSFNTSFVFTRKKIDKSKLFFLVVIPQDIYSNEIQEKIIRSLRAQIPHEGFECLTIPGDQFYRLHCYFDQPNLPNWKANIPELEKAIETCTKSWIEGLKDAIYKHYPIPEADDIYFRYHELFPVHHQVRRSPEQSVEDISFFEKVNSTNSVQFNLFPFKFKESVLSNKASVLHIYHREKIDLYRFIPIFRNLQLYFIDELTTRIGTVNNIIGYIHAFRICQLDRSNIDVASIKTKLIDLLTAVFNGQLPNDPLNGLVSTAHLNWKEIFIVQAYRNYLLQLKPNYTKDKIDRSLLNHPKSCNLLVLYFNEKFNKKKDSKRVKQYLLTELEKQFYDSLNSVSDIDEDYILKWFFNILQNTVRCNYNKNTIQEYPVVAFKFDCEQLKMPLPKPYRELFVFGPEVEGIHIRFGAVSRGGIRWSNRANDYRSEVLGLAVTQRVKNVVIVPNGSKGGFIIKKSLPAEERVAESKKQYKAYINALLSITDSVDERNKIIKSKHSIIYDENDPYLVVAADKGTATFSDTANEISQQREFWLDDAFASGGSNGYSHKDLGITAKGAWECVKLHFLEQNKDIQKESFTVIGVGDMSGDVFGNGMLLSKKTKLIAAFNHIEIFIDPDPDPAKSYKERKRLFELPHSKWSDYSPKAFSKGGSVFNRNAKQIKLNKEIQQLLQLDTDELNGEELIHAILKCNTELLWFAGIGTYIKSNSQTHFEVGDLANNSVRINHSDCKAQVIGEGANLALTQKARIKLSQMGSKINTDFIDNSAGVNISDYEVNLKLFLSTMQKIKALNSVEERHKLLEKASNEVIEKVLENNKAQHRLISMEELRSKQSITRYLSFIQTYIQKGLLNPDVDTIPKQSTFDELHEKNDPLPRPFLALLQSLVKLDISEQLLDSTQLNHNFFDELFLSYFPQSIYDTFNDKLFKHPLKKEITATLLTNYVVNNAGILFISLIQEITNKKPTDIAISYFIVNQLFDCDQIRADIQSQSISFAEKYNSLIALEDILKTVVIDALMMTNKAFNLPQYKAVKKQFDIFKKEVLPKLKTKVTVTSNSTLANLEYRLHFMSIYNSNQLKKGMGINKLKQFIHCKQHFKFYHIRKALNSIALQSGWEVEEYNLLQRLLSQKKLSIIHKCLNTFDAKKDVQDSDYEAIFSDDLKRFKHNLTILMQVDNPCLSSLNVLINQLNSL